MHTNHLLLVGCLDSPNISDFSQASISFQMPFLMHIIGVGVSTGKVLLDNSAVDVIVDVLRVLEEGVGVGVLLGEGEGVLGEGEGVLKEGEGELGEG